MSGFILQPTYRITAGRAVVHLYGRLETGQTFLVRDDREVPHFFIRQGDALRARALYDGPILPTERRSLAGEPVSRVEVRTPPDTPPLRQRLQQAGIPTYEADIRFPQRYLINRGIRGAALIRGPSHRGAGVDRVFDRPDLAPARLVPRLSILSLDIETDPRAERLLSVALYSNDGRAEVLLLGPPAPAPASVDGAGVAVFATEAELLRALCQRVRALDPDVLVGWNVIDFDLTVLDRLARRHRAPLLLGRGAGGLRLFTQPTSRASLPGRVILDGIQLLRGAFIRMEEYSLDAVSAKVLQQRKTLKGPDRAQEILALYERDPAGFCEYNLNDARLALDVLQKLRVIDLAVERSLLTGMPLDRVSGSIASFDFLYLTELGRRGVVAPTVTWDDEPEEPTAGGTVLDPEPGLHRNVLVFDFKSLYPSIIRTFQIDPLGYLPAPRPEDDAIVAPSGAAFRRRPGILTQLLDRLAPQREAAQRAGDATKSYAIKILMNSFYGVLGTPACRFHNPELANAITSFGQMVLLHAKARIEARGHRVLYGDTDSLFVLSGAADPEAARALGRELAEAVDEDLRAHLRSAYRVESRLHLSFQALYLRLLLLRTRGGAQGARKRYAGLLCPASDGEAPRVVFTGMEVVRSDWTELAKEVQRRLYERLFADQPVDAYLREVVAAVRAGRMDELLVYRKSLRKDLQRYTATTPPHVAAARKLAGAPGRTMSYVMTRSGPEPAAERRSPIDHEHYVQKQVRPVAEPVLALLGLDFDRVVGDNTQLELAL